MLGVWWPMWDPAIGVVGVGKINTNVGVVGVGKNNTNVSVGFSSREAHVAILGVWWPKRGGTSSFW